MKDVINFDEIDELGPQSYDATFNDITVADVDRFEVVGVGPVRIEANAEKVSDAEYVVDGTLHFTADFDCSRCLEPYPFANTSNFHVRFRPRPAATPENEEVEITAAEELDVEFYTEREIPLRDLALEQVQLVIPMKPLCEENCLGLCPSCGANRNRETCRCDESAGDERWGALAGIRDQLAKKKQV
ncbi:MAG TPA: DUF177 domain-containing protein [Thermoanaerobaculia bacterium]|nr:DUF177 domain-containing protein [Thermoanaerobaculia bacterium]